jgi:hypothetical protein
MSENLKLWQAVEKTDPKYTKAFSKAGGFSGTAINATYLLRKATEQWGPIGGSWGPLVEDEKYVTGADGTIIHVLRIKFRHPGGEFHAYGQTTFVGKNKNGAFTDEEAPKKSLTDAITKSLAMLGFSADVFLGLYDDNKYVNDLRAEFNEGTGVIKPTDGARSRVTPARRKVVEDTAILVKDALNEDRDFDAYAHCENFTDPDEKVYLWTFLDSKQRSRLKAQSTVANGVTQ